MVSDNLSMVRFNPDVVAYQSEEEQTEASDINHSDSRQDLKKTDLSREEEEDKNKFLQRDIVKYLRHRESKKYWTSNNNSFQDNNGKGRNWNLVKQRFHEKDVFFAKEAKVLEQRT